MKEDRAKIKVQPSTKDKKANKVQKTTKDKKDSNMGMKGKVKDC